MFLSHVVTERQTGQTRAAQRAAVGRVRFDDIVAFQIFRYLIHSLLHRGEIPRILRLMTVKYHLKNVPLLGKQCDRRFKCPYRLCRTGENSSVCVCSRPCSNIFMVDTSVSRFRQGRTVLCLLSQCISAFDLHIFDRTVAKNRLLSRFRPGHPPVSAVLFVPTRGLRCCRRLNQIFPCRKSISKLLYFAFCRAAITPLLITVLSVITRCGMANIDHGKARIGLLTDTGFAVLSFRARAVRPPL